MSTADKARQNFGALFVLLVVLMVAWYRTSTTSSSITDGMLSLDGLVSALGWISSIVGFDLVPSWMPLAVAWSSVIGIAVVLAGVAILAQMAVSREDVDPTGFAGSALSTIQTLGVLFGAAFILLAFDSIEQALFYSVVGGIVLVFSWIVWVYLQERRKRARQETAIRHTRRAAERQLSDYVEGAFGFVVITITAALAIVSGLLAAVSGLGDALLPLAPEFAYVGSTILGYVSLGGSLPVGTWLIPDLSPMQYLGISLMIGGLAIMAKQ